MSAAVSPRGEHRPQIPPTVQNLGVDARSLMSLDQWKMRLNRGERIRTSDLLRPRPIGGYIDEVGLFLPKKGYRLQSDPNFRALARNVKGVGWKMKNTVHQNRYGSGTMVSH